MLIRILAISLFAALGLGVQAQPTLVVGEKAPKLAIGEWVKGEPVEELEGRVHVVEFWATWCPPCVKSIPHLSELQAEHSEKVAIIGVSVDRQTELVAPFVEDKGTQMDYRVGIDDAGKMSESWMQAAGQNGIPCAFIVQPDGVIAWIGNPLDPRFDTTLSAVIAGRYDIKEAAAAAQHAAEGERRRAELLIKAEPLKQQIMELWGQEDYDAALRVADEIVALDPEVFVNVVQWKFEQMLGSLNRSEEATAYAKRLLEKEYAESPVQLQYLASMLAGVSEPESDLTEIARAMAARAVKLSEAAQAAGDELEAPLWRAYETLAFIDASRGEWKTAAEAQGKAVEALGEDDEPYRQGLIENLEYYQIMAEMN